MTAPRHADVRVAHIVELLERIGPADLASLGEHYRADARFKDPFNDVQGLAAIERVFGHMFAALDAPRMVVRDIVVQGDDCFLTWDFVFRFKRLRSGEQRVQGASHLRLAADGRIAFHRDYWDAAEELYEKLPLVGVLMRWLRRRATA
jgi:steroid Delta-isomerase